MGDQTAPDEANKHFSSWPRSIVLETQLDHLLLIPCLRRNFDLPVVDTTSSTNYKQFTFQINMKTWNCMEVELLSE